MNRETVFILWYFPAIALAGSLVFAAAAVSIWRGRGKGALAAIAKSGKSLNFYYLRGYIAFLLWADILTAILLLDAAKKGIFNPGQAFFNTILGSYCGFVESLVLIVIFTAFIHTAFCAGVYFGLRVGRLRDALHIGFFSLCGATGLNLIFGKLVGALVYEFSRGLRLGWEERQDWTLISVFIINGLLLGVLAPHLMAGRALRKAFIAASGASRAVGPVRRLLSRLWELVKSLFREREGLTDEPTTAGGAALVERRELKSRSLRARIFEIAALALPLAVWVVLSPEMLKEQRRYYGYGRGRYLEQITEFGGIAFFIYYFWLTCAAAISAASSFYAERRNGTLEMLLLTPLGLSDVLVGKARAAQGGARFMFKYIAIVWFFLGVLPPVWFVGAASGLPAAAVVGAFMLLLLAALLLAPRPAAALGCIIGASFASPFAFTAALAFAIIAYLAFYFAFFVMGATLFFEYSVIAGLAVLAAVSCIFGFAVPRLFLCGLDGARWLDFKERFFLPLRRIFQPPRGRLPSPAASAEEVRALFHGKPLSSPAFSLFRALFISAFLVCGLLTVEFTFRGSWHIFIDMNDESAVAVFIMAPVAAICLLAAGAGSVFRDRRLGLIRRYKDAGICWRDWLRHEWKRHLLPFWLITLAAAVFFSALLPAVDTGGYGRPWSNDAMALLLMFLICLFALFAPYYLGVYIAASRRRLRDIVFESILVFSGYCALAVGVAAYLGLLFDATKPRYSGDYYDMMWALWIRLLAVIAVEVVVLGFILPRVLARSALKRLWEENPVS